MEKVYYDNQPDVLTKVGDGSYRYAWDIEPFTLNDPDIEPIDRYSAYEVVVWSPLTSNKITEAVISAIWPMSYEQKLVNEYNSALLGLLPENEANAKIEAYRSFLAERGKLKEQVDKDCKNLGIR